MSHSHTLTRNILYDPETYEKKFSYVKDVPFSKVKETYDRVGDRVGVYLDFDVDSYYLYEDYKKIKDMSRKGRKIYLDERNGKIPLVDPGKFLPYKFLSFYKGIIISDEPYDGTNRKEVGDLGYYTKHTIDRSFYVDDLDDAIDVIEKLIKLSYEFWGDWSSEHRVRNQQSDTGTLSNIAFLGRRALLTYGGRYMKDDIDMLPYNFISYFDDIIISKYLSLHNTRNTHIETITEDDLDVYFYTTNKKEALKITSMVIAKVRDVLKSLDITEPITAITFDDYSKARVYIRKFNNLTTPSDFIRKYKNVDIYPYGVYQGGFANELEGNYFSRNLDEAIKVLDEIIEINEQKLGIPIKRMTFLPQNLFVNVRIFVDNDKYKLSPPYEYFTVYKGIQIKNWDKYKNGIVINKIGEKDHTIKPNINLKFDVYSEYGAEKVLDEIIKLHEETKEFNLPLDVMAFSGPTVFLLSNSKDND